MQTLQVIRTIKWIDGLLSDETKEALFSIRMRDVEREKGGGAEDLVSRHLNAAHLLGAASLEMSRNPDAIAVLDAFELSPLLDRQLIAKLFTAKIIKGGDDPEIHDTLRKLGPTYYRMVLTSSAWGKLTTPPELQTDEPPEGLLTMNISITNTKAANVAVLSTATALLNDLYEAISAVYQQKSPGALVLVKIESGSSIRVDCKGLGDVVRHIKEFLLEAWHKVRHKRPEEVIENNKALLTSLAIIDHINSRVSHHGLSPEEGEALRRRVLKDAFGLFESGALIAEIPVEERVDNTRLLGGFSPRLLAAHASASPAASPQQAKKHRNVPSKKPDVRSKHKT